jgi:predicted HAD superfamily Cof-like phosphohydrolase
MSVEERLLSANLLLEETFETIRALGVSVYHETADAGEITFDMLHIQDGMHEHDIVEIVDGLTDVTYIVAGVFVRMGLPDRPFFDAVHENNMLKVLHGTIDSRGKLIKPDGHKPPDLCGVLRLIEETWPGGDE